MSQLGHNLIILESLFDQADELSIEDINFPYHEITFTEL